MVLKMYYDFTEISGFNAGIRRTDAIPSPEF
jgi:hypothetical protein